MKTVKTWVLTKAHYDESDIRWLTSSGCEISIKESKAIEVSYGSRMYYAGNQQPEVQIKTTCEKQETMLQLKYSNNLCLLRIDYENIDMEPYS